MNTVCAVAVLSLVIVCPAAAQEKPAAPAGKEAAAGVVRRLIGTTYGGQRLHLVGSDGSIQPFTLPQGTVWGSGGDGGFDDPVLSPDGKSAAFICNGALTLRPLAGGKGTVVVSGYRHEEFYITGWSPDGQALVYFLGPPQSEDPPPSKITERQHYLYDLKTKQTRTIAVPGQLAGWLPGGEMLLWQEDGQRSAVWSLSLEPGAKPKELLSETADAFSQVTLSPDGTRIATGISARNTTTSNQLFSIELATGKRTPLRAPGKWAEIQWPRWSPSGRHLSWEANVEMKEGIPWNVLVVDGKPVTQPAVLGSHYWLTDTAIAVVESGAIAVIEPLTGKSLGRKAFGKP